MTKRKLYLSFAGAGNYTTVTYKNEKLGIDHYTQFAQVATAKSAAKNFTTDDAVIIFTTPEAEEKYWADDQRKPKELQKQLLDLNLACSVNNKPINSGSTEADIWEMFTTIFECIKENDIVYFDVTSGFRSQPLLTLPLINYAKFLKNVTVAGIYYGNFQGAGNNAPVWDLTDFSKLQDWTNNANIFLRTGNAKGLAKQIEGDTFKNVKQGLERFSEFTLVNRGMDIYRGSEIVQLSKDLEAVEAATNPAEKAVVPILKKVKDQFLNYQENSAINGFHAARWCIQNGLIQQATTLLEEFVTSFAIELIGETDFIQDEKFRTFISGTLSVNEEKLIYPKLASFEDNELILIARKVYSLSDYKKLSKLANQIKNSIRNDINHAGFRSAPRDFTGLSDSIVKRYNDLTKLLKVRGFEIPKL
jgi:CRISPR-associated Csx2 family protein